MRAPPQAPGPGTPTEPGSTCPVRPSAVTALVSGGRPLKPRSGQNPWAGPPGNSRVQGVLTSALSGQCWPGTQSLVTQRCPPADSPGGIPGVCSTTHEHQSPFLLPQGNGGDELTLETQEQTTHGLGHGAVAGTPALSHEERADSKSEGSRLHHRASTPGGARSHGRGRPSVPSRLHLEAMTPEHPGPHGQWEESNCRATESGANTAPPKALTLSSAVAPAGRQFRGGQGAWTASSTETQLLPGLLSDAVEMGPANLHNCPENSEYGLACYSKTDAPVQVQGEAFSIQLAEPFLLVPRESPQP